MARHIPDFESYYGNKRLSDVRLVLVEEGNDSSGKRRRQQEHELPCHSMVLLAYSSYCKAKLENWDTARSSRSSSSKGSSSQLHRIEMSVPAGQLEVGQLLIKGMYQRQPDLSSLSQLQLLQLLLLADRYEVPKVLDAVCETVEAISADQLQWEVVSAVYQLPAGCTELQGCKGVFSAAAAKLQRELGDLEIVWAGGQQQSGQEPDADKQSLLCGLPFAALKQLLQDDRTRVSSENTVFYTIQQWHEQQQRVAQQQVKELMHLIRIRHCSPLYVSTVMCNNTLFTRCFSPSEMGLACILAGAGTASASQAAADHYRGLQQTCPILYKYPSWKLDKRPASAMQQLVVDWRPTLQELQEGVGLSTYCFTSVVGRTVTWRGWSMEPGVSIDGGTKQVLGRLHFYLNTVPWVVDRAFLVSGKTTVVAASSASTSQGRHLTARASSISHCYTNEYCTTTLYVHSLAALDSFSGWSELEAALRSKQLVHPDGTLHIRFEVTDLM